MIKYKRNKNKLKYFKKYDKTEYKRKNVKNMRVKKLNVIFVIKNIEKII
jgi:hypothetical protein